MWKVCKYQVLKSIIYSKFSLFTILQRMNIILGKLRWCSKYSNLFDHFEIYHDTYQGFYSFYLLAVRKPAWVLIALTSVRSVYLSFYGSSKAGKHCFCNKRFPVCKRNICCCMRKNVSGKLKIYRAISNTNCTPKQMCPTRENGDN